MFEGILVNIRMMLESDSEHFCSMHDKVKNRGLYYLRLDCILCAEIQTEGAFHAAPSD